MIQSMTGFARAEQSHETASWVWELRSVNGKSLDLRFRLPSGFERFEQRLKEVAAKHVQRGNIQVSLQLEQLAGGAVPTLNEAAFDAAVAICKKAAQRADLPMPGLEGILSLKGVVEYVAQEDDIETLEALGEALVSGFEEVVQSLATARRNEGEAIAKVVNAQVDRIAGYTQSVKNDPSRTTAAIRERLAANVASLLESVDTLDSQRLYQEAAILATKADLQEEIDRLEAHVEAARKLIASGEPVGRKLDFLAQEFNRECNTICSKSNAPSVTAAGLEMKVVIDQFREQIQNIQ